MRRSENECIWNWQGRSYTQAMRILELLCELVKKCGFSHVTASACISFAFKIFDGFGITPVKDFIRNRQATGNGSISIIVYSTKFCSG
jgi:hypothetical protein